MRLWHKDLIPLLPRQQLLGQWRELCLIAKRIKETGSPGHVLVGRITDYPLDHLCSYAETVSIEMEARGYHCDRTRFTKYLPSWSPVPYQEIFAGWHTDRYFLQCFYNMEEKYDCGAIPEDEWRYLSAHVG